MVKDGIPLVPRSGSWSLTVSIVVARNPVKISSLDLHAEASQMFVRVKGGDILREMRISTNREQLRRALSEADAPDSSSPAPADHPGSGVRNPGHTRGRKRGNRHIGALTVDR